MMSFKMNVLTLVTFLLFFTFMPAISNSQYLVNNILAHRKILIPKQETVLTTSYAVIFDAGSSGSRVHVYNFDQNLDLLHIGNDIEFAEKIEPGLSAYANNPPEAAKALIPLLEKAESVIPEEQHSRTPVRLAATAGLRLLDAGTSEKILQGVRDMLNNRSSLKVEPDAVSIIDGTQEGSYMWVTVNYLLGKLGNKYTKTVGIIDLGGASVQMAYAVSKKTAQHAPKVSEGEDPYIKKIVLKGRQYDLYVHSYLRYGKDAARAEIFKVTDGSPSPCILAGFNGTYKYSGEEYKIFSPAAGSNYGECREKVLKVLKVDAPCPHANCTFGGIWNGGKGNGQKNLFAASALVYLPEDVGMIESKKPNSKIRAVDYEIEAKRACGLTYEGAKKTYPGLEEKKRPYVCVDLTYMYALLVDGFGLDPNKEFTVGRNIKYEDAAVEAAWPLGNAVEAISSLPKFNRMMYFI